MIPRFVESQVAKLTREGIRKTVQSFQESAQQAKTAAAQHIVAEVKKSILQQTFKAEPLTPAWAARKARNGLDPRTLVATKQYVEGIRAEKGAITCDAALRQFHEYGTKSMPARPHWTPVLLREGKKVATIFGQTVLKGLP